MAPARRPSARATAAKLLALVLGVVTGVGAASGCTPGQAWPVSPDIGLGRDASGRLLLVGNLCSVALAKVELGEGRNPFDKAQSAVVPTARATDHSRIDVESPGPAFRLTSGTDPSTLAIPIWVRVSAPDGFWATAVFDVAPEPGSLIAVPYGSRSRGLQSVPLDAYPVGSPDCGGKG